MSELLRKHEQSCEAAENLLVRDKLYAASVHCAYYSCIQLLTYTFIYKVYNIPAIDRPQFFDEMQDNGGTHNYLRREMKRELIRLGISRTKAIEFETSLKELKTIRTEGDYFETSISLSESREARRMSEEINTLIKTTFSIS